MIVEMLAVVTISRWAWGGANSSPCSVVGGIGPCRPFNCTADQLRFDPQPAPCASSTPSGQPVLESSRVIPVEALWDIISDLALKIGDSISAKLGTVLKPCTAQPQFPPGQQANEAVVPPLKVLCNLTRRLCLISEVIIQIHFLFMSGKT